MGTTEALPLLEEAGRAPRRTLFGEIEAHNVFDGGQLGERQIGKTRFNDRRDKDNQDDEEEQWWCAEDREARQRWVGDSYSSSSDSEEEQCSGYYDFRESRGDHASAHQNRKALEFLSPDEQATESSLQLPLSPGQISTRVAAFGEAQYLAGGEAVRAANEVFGFDGWSSSIIDCSFDIVDPPEGDAGQPRDSKSMEGVKSNIVNRCWRVCATAHVRVEARQAGSHHEEIGVGTAVLPDCAQAISVARKQAVTDATKRCLRLFGEGLGNSLQHSTLATTTPVEAKLPSFETRERTFAPASEQLW